MDMEGAEEARRWLAECGVRQTGDGWVDADEPDRIMTANDVAHYWAGVVFTDEDLDRAGQVRLAFGMLDLLDDYWVTCEIGFAYHGKDTPPPAEPLWEGFRRRLEAERNAEPVEYSLWVDWFEDRRTSATAFAEVLGNDIGLLLHATPPGPLRRARRVLACSGPVPWAAKAEAFATAVRVPELHPALFRGLLTGYHDVYGDLEPAPALALLDRLDLPPDTEHLAPLRTVLTAGHTNHRHAPQAWDAAGAPSGRRREFDDRP
ncbi:hypothetical protein OOK31_05885 [Streptomyces sp. NBC_00249]|uniref:hypothetical protein n=1 Tax=Streptomyces sp. NBC_00249 TaxID=2975690 RepID=UPI00224D0979|nr:hypothetical protein [Streptomyces sp. NBC_00249]MCX5193423.1 hypothetical protein [Streptomyces sp. NBC_00249]